MSENHAIGDIVTPNPDAQWAKRMLGATYKITDVPKGRTGVNYKASPCNPDGTPRPGQGLRGPGWALLPASPDAAATVVVEEYVPNHPIGSIVASDGSRQAPEGFYVVIGETDSTRIRIILIGDTSGRYWRATSKYLTLVDPVDVIAALERI